MKKKNNIMYLVDNYIYLSNKGHIIKHSLDNNILNNGRIANIKLFIEQYNKLLDKNRISLGIFNEVIDVIINPSYTKADIEVLKNILNSIGYHKVNTINEFRLYKLNKSNAYFNYNNEYYILSFINMYDKKESYLIEANLLTEKELIKVIKHKINNKDLLVFGLNDNIDMFINNFKNGYHFNNDETYLIDLFFTS